jgi:hypothetical protein
MRTFCVSICIFLLALVSILTLIANINLPDSFLIQRTYNTEYNKIAWNINTINKHPDKIKDALVFFGPSLVEGGICDSMLNKGGIKSINLGVRHTGKEIELYFLKRIAKLKPEGVYFYANGFSVSSHPMASLLYSPSDLIAAGQAINYSFLDYYFKRITLVFQYFFSILENETPVAYQYASFGCQNRTIRIAPDEFKVIDAVTPELNTAKLSFARKTWRNLYQLFIKRILNGNSQYAFLLNAQHLAKINSIPFRAIHIPELNDCKTDSFHLKSFFPEDIKIQYLHTYSDLNKMDYWSDRVHLSNLGAFIYNNDLLAKRVFISPSIE